MLIQYLYLFISSFMAATFLPFYSEIYLYLLIRNEFTPLIVFIVATTGNTLGALVNWSLGKYLLIFRDKKWFYFNQRQIDNSQRWYSRYGIWSLIFSWLPLGGDALTLIAGIMRAPLLKFIFLVALGKGIRYAVVIYFTLNIELAM